MKDAFNEYVVNDRKEAVNPANTGTKAAALYELSVAPGETRMIRLRLTDTAPQPSRERRAKPGDGILENNLMR